MEPVLLFIIISVVAALAVTAAIMSYRFGKQRGAVEGLPDRLTKEELSKVLKDLTELRSRFQGEHDAIMSEKNRMLSSVESENKRYVTWTKEYEQCIKRIDDSLGSISTKAISEVKNMAGVIQPVVAMFKTPQIAGIQYAEAELELLLKTHLGEGLYERKPANLAVGNECVDFIIKLPDCVIPTDSKFPEAVYRSWTDAKDEAEAKPRWRTFRDTLLKQMEATAKYIRPEIGTTDYALLFLPSDVIWQQAFLVRQWYGEDNPILRRSQELRVFGCSSQTLMPYVGLLRLGLRNLKVADDVKAVRQQIDQLKTSFGQFVQDWNTLRRHIGNAQGVITEAEASSKGSFAKLQRGVDRLTDHEVGKPEDPSDQQQRMLSVPISTGGGPS